MGIVSGFLFNTSSTVLVSNVPPITGIECLGPFENGLT